MVGQLRRMQEGWTARKNVESAQKNVGKLDSSEKYRQSFRRIQEGWTDRKNVERVLRGMQDGWRAKKNAGSFQG